MDTKNEVELRALLTISTGVGSSRIQIDVREGFDDGLTQPENVAERLLVEALVAERLRQAAKPTMWVNASA